jgi:hypothetical protein
MAGNRVMSVLRMSAVPSTQFELPLGFQFAALFGRLA